MIFLTVTLCIMGSGVAQAAWSYNLTPYLWAEDYTYYRVGSTVSQKGSSWVDATRKSAGKWSNHHSNDVSKYGLSPLLYDFYFYWLSYSGGSQKYDHTIGFKTLELGTLGKTTQTGDYEDGWSQADGDTWYIRVNNDYPWSLSADGSDYYFCYWSIVTHELGHAAGLDHPDATSWDNLATRPTMWNGLNEGEYWQRTLEAGDYEGLYQGYGYH